jgi:hypothetical protein
LNKNLTDKTGTDSEEDGLEIEGMPSQQDRVNLKALIG